MAKAQKKAQLETAIVETVAPEEQLNIESCPVVRYCPENGILGFTFKGMPVQIGIETGLSIGAKVLIRYTEDADGHVTYTLEK